MNIVQASREHIQPVRRLLTACVRDLRRRGIHQWDEIYPDLDAVAADMASGTLYVALQEGRCVGAVCLDEEQDGAYQTVDWMGGEPVLVVHRLCVAPARQGQGIATRIMDYAEGLAAERGYASIRLDAYTGNEQAMRLYRRRGYTVAGSVLFPRRVEPFCCMEKILCR